MQADNDNRYEDTPEKGGLPILPIAIVLLLVAAVGIWFFASSDDTGSASDSAVSPPAATASEPPVARPEPEPAPDIPEPVTPAPAVDIPAENASSNEPPLTLNNSDGALREYFADAGDSELIQQTLQGEHLIEVTTALVDAASHGIVLRKLLPLPAPNEAFKVTQMDGTLVMDPAGYARYNSFASSLVALDSETMASGFHKFRPLLEEAYAALGYDSDELDNTLIRALDTIIAAPTIEQPIAVVKNITTYNFADASLEKLSPIAKQLLRMGPENQALIQQQAAALRSALLESGAPTRSSQ